MIRRKRDEERESDRSLEQPGLLELHQVLGLEGLAFLELLVDFLGLGLGGLALLGAGVLALALFLLVQLAEALLDADEVLVVRSAASWASTKTSCISSASSRMSSASR